MPPPRSASCTTPARRTRSAIVASALQLRVEQEQGQAGGSPSRWCGGGLKRDLPGGRAHALPRRGASPGDRSPFRPLARRPRRRQPLLVQRRWRLLRRGSPVQDTAPGGAQPDTPYWRNTSTAPASALHLVLSVRDDSEAGRYGSRRERARLVRGRGLDPAVPREEIYGRTMAGKWRQRRRHCPSQPRPHRTPRAAEPYAADLGPQAPDPQALDDDADKSWSTPPPRLPLHPRRRQHRDRGRRPRARPRTRSAIRVRHLHVAVEVWAHPPQKIHRSLCARSRRRPRHPRRVSR